MTDIMITPSGDTGPISPNEASTALPWGFDPDALLQAAISLHEQGDETAWYQVCQQARDATRLPPVLARLALGSLDSMALVLLLALQQGHPAAEVFLDKDGPTLHLLAQLCSPDAASYPATLAHLADSALLQQRLVLTGQGTQWAQWRPSPQLMQQLTATPGQQYDCNRLLQRLAATPARVARHGLPQAQGCQLVGPEGSGRKSALLAAAADTPVYLVNSTRFYQFDSPEELLADLLTFVDLNHGWLLWPDDEQLLQQPALLLQIERWLGGHPARRFIRLAQHAEHAPAMLASQWLAGLPSAEEAQSLWRAVLPAAWSDKANLASLARLYPLLPGDMQRIAANLHGAPSQTALQQACLAHLPASLGALARRVNPRRRLDEMCLPEAERQALGELMWRYQQRHALQDAGLAHGSGLCALFWGKPGTGKTLAAHAVAAELALPLYQVNLAQVSSKWIGETEKHLATLFDAAERQSCVLFFDEADAVFGKRSEVKDSHDRNANLSVSYLLQRLDDSSALAILASNFKQNLDPAFLRRFAQTVEFTLPDAARRLALWQDHADLLCLPATRLAALADLFELTPAQIANIAQGVWLAQAAQPDSCPVSRVAHALAREFDKHDQGYAMRARIHDWSQGNHYV